MKKLILIAAIFILPSLSFAHGTSQIEMTGDAIKAVADKIAAEAPAINEHFMGLKAQPVGAQIEVKVYIHAEPKKPFVYLCTMVHPSGGNEYFDCPEQPR